MAPRFDPERAGMVLAEAAFYGDSPTVARHGITLRTLQNWRRRLVDDAELSRYFALKKAVLADAWLDDVNRALAAGADYVARAARELPLSPENLHAVAGAMKILAEATITKGALSAGHAEPHRATAGAPGAPVPIAGGRRSA